MADPFSGVFSGMSDPGERALAIVPSDANDLPETQKAIYVGTAVADMIAIY